MQRSHATPGASVYRSRALALVVVVLLASAGCGSLIVTEQSVDALAGRRGFTWDTKAIDGFVIYYEPGSTGECDVGAVSAAAQRARRRVLAYLQEPPYEEAVTIFLVDSRARMKDLIGRPTKATAYHSSNTLCLVHSGTWHASVTHELAHVRSGPPDESGAAVQKRVSAPWAERSAQANPRACHGRGSRPS